MLNWTIPKRVNDVDTVKDATICFKKLRIRRSFFPATFEDASTIKPISRAWETTVTKKNQNMMNIMLLTHSNKIFLISWSIFNTFLQVQKTLVEVGSRVRAAYCRRLFFGCFGATKIKKARKFSIILNLFFIFEKNC